MEPFFAAFPGLVHEQNESPEKNFRRLQETQEWTDLEYLTIRRQFLEALVGETKSPVHGFFVTEHPDFLTYDSDMPPRSEFERLRIFKNWTEEGLYEDSRALFEAAFKTEFSGASDPTSKPPAEPLFAPFPRLVRNQGESPEGAFRRIQQTEKWSDLEYLTFRRQFLEALVQETKSPVHRFFVTEHPDFLTYDSDMPPRSEFERLRIFKNWTEDGLGEDSRASFEAAFKAEFSGALDGFFSRYVDDFLYHPRRPPMAEFHRLMKHKNWRRSEDRYKSARTSFFEAFMVDFNVYFGTNENDIKTWQHLCEVLGIDPIPVTITKCRKILQPLNINIHDLLHHKRTGAPFESFATPMALRKYTKKNGLIFPKAKAKEGPLRFLLRGIFTSGRRRTADT